MKTVSVLCLMIFVSVCFGADAPPERVAGIALITEFVKSAWPALIAWGISEIMPFLPTKANGIAELIKLWIVKEKQ